MALIKCKECGNEISKNADFCPKCGSKKHKQSRASLLFLIFLSIIIFSIISSVLSNNNDYKPQTNIVAQETTIKNKPTPIPTKAPTATPEPIGSQWFYSADSDPMSGKKTYYAMVLSTNTVNFNPPYSGEQNAKLTIRSNQRLGNDIIISIRKGQILCRTYNNCSVLIRFDNGEAKEYSAAEPADHSTETVFIRDYEKFLSNLKKANTVRIAVDIYQEGQPVFEFDVNGFDQNKYKPK